MLAIDSGIIAFLVVAGWAALRWMVSGRDPSYLDDASILLAAPPDGMTAATATVVDGGPVPVAFMAALLDLASRDEIAFREEGVPGAPGDRVGIEIHGQPTDDARIRLNRRRPVGEGEAWLLAALKAYEIEGRTGLSLEERGLAGMQALSGIIGFAAGAMAGGPESQAPGALVDGMSSGGLVDPQEAIVEALTRAGKPVPPRLQEALAARRPMMDLMAEALRDPAPIAADPAPFAARVEAVTGRPMTPDDLAEIQRFAQGRVAAVAAPAATSGPPPAPYVSAARALTFHPPMGFGSMLESYARRQGWIVGMSFLARLKWRILAVVEVIVGIVLAGIDQAGSGAIYGAGLGMAAGGVATWLIAPLMASRTQQGAVMKAQLAAYRRTLQATFASSPTLDAAVTTAGLTWLETPDQALVWGVALGLRSDVEALLRRTTSGIAAGTLPAGSFVPRWVRRLEAATSAVVGGAGPTAPVATAPMPGAVGSPGVPAPGSPAAPPAGVATTMAPPPGPGAVAEAVVAERDYAGVFTAIERIGSQPTRS